MNSNWINENNVIPYAFDDDKVSKYAKRYDVEGKLTIMYSGNIGLYYDLENISRVINEFADYKDLQFVFVGEGANLDTLVDYCKRKELDNVKFFPYVPKEEVVYSLNAADVHLVTNQKGIKGVSVPSKIYGVLAVGKPVLGILEIGSEAEQIISESGCGKVVEPQDYDGIHQLIQWYCENQESCASMGLKGRKYLEDNYRMATSLSKYRKLIDELSGNVDVKVTEDKVSVKDTEIEEDRVS